MTVRNERKLEVLKFVAAEEEVTTEQVAEAFDMEIHNARMQLKRYWKSGLLHRRVIDRKTKKRAYRITEKGIGRISWLEDNGQSFTTRIRKLVDRIGTCECQPYK